MKLIKSLLLFGLMGLLCKTAYGRQNAEREEKVSFSVLKIWQDFHKKSCSCTCPIEDAPWKDGVEDHYNGCRGAIDKFCGKARKVGDVAVNLLREYFTKLIYLTDANSTIVTTSSTGILNSMSRGNHLNKNGLNIITEFNKIFLPIIDDFVNVAKPLDVHIGDLIGSFTDALRDLGAEFSNYMNEFLESCRLFGCRKKIDYECVLKKLQKLMNHVALINETLLNKCAKASRAVHEAVMVLDLLYCYMAIAVQGIYSCALDALNARDVVVSENLRSSSLSFEYAAVQVTQAICAVTLPLDRSITSLLTAFVNITMALNLTLKNHFGLVDGVEITVGVIVKNLLKGHTITTTLAQDRTNILKGVVPQ